MAVPVFYLAVPVFYLAVPVFYLYLIPKIKLHVLAHLNWMDWTLPDAGAFHVPWIAVFSAPDE